MSKKKGFGKFLAGIAIGTGIGMLFAPDKGSVTRQKLKIKLDELINQLKDVDVEEVKAEITMKVKEIKSELENLDKEKVTKIAKDQALKIQKKAEELYKYAVAKGTPLLEKAADEVRVQALKVAKNVVKKLEKEKSKK